MPRADITSDFRSDNGQSRFPRLKLQAGEKARVVILGKPIVEYVHRLEAPNIVNMAPTYKKIKNREGNDEYVIETRWVSSPICMGTYEILKERGVDDKTCQACMMARERPDIFRPPQPKYAVNIIRYGLRPGGSWNDIAAPYGVTTLIWSFGGKVMDKLIDIRAMGPAYDDIRQVDLLLECSHDGYNFQKPYSNGEFLPVSPAFWLTSDQIRNYTIAYFQQNGASEDDLTAAIGRRVKPDWLADDLSRVQQRWDVVRAHEARQGGAPAMVPGFGVETLGQGMAHLQQQYGQQFGQPGAGFVPAGPQGYAQPAAGPDPGVVVQPQMAGVDMNLLGGSALTQAAGVDMDQLYQQQRAALMGAGVPAEMLPGAVSGQGTFPTTFPSPSATAAVPPTVPQSQMAPAQTVPSSSNGLGEFAAPTTSNPAASIPGADMPAPADFAGLADVRAPVAQAPAAGIAGLEAMMATQQPAAVPAADQSPPAARSYTFADLERLAGQ